jgi:hypothetical protein
MRRVYGTRGSRRSEGSTSNQPIQHNSGVKFRSQKTRNNLTDYTQDLNAENAENAEISEYAEHWRNFSAGVALFAWSLLLFLGGGAAALGNSWLPGF